MKIFLGLLKWFAIAITAMTVGFFDWFVLFQIGVWAAGPVSACMVFTALGLLMCWVIYVLVDAFIEEHQL